METHNCGFLGLAASSESSDSSDEDDIPLESRASKIQSSCVQETNVVLKGRKNTSENKKKKEVQKFFIVGQAPNSNGLGEEGHLMGKFGERLAKMLGISMKKYLSVNRRNLIAYYPGKSGKGDNFPFEEAKSAAYEMEKEFGRGAEILLLGKNVAKAFGFGNMKFLDSTEIGGVMFHLFPHPSGVNRWWNNPNNTKAAKIFAKKIARRAIF